MEQWQDELYHKFHLSFEILTNDRIDSAVSGNVFTEMNLCIARLDKLARNDDLKKMLEASDWDLIVCDEAHKMSATIWGGEVKYTKRFQLGRMLSAITRNFLLLTATPHNGKDEDFHLFLSLIDSDRFEGTHSNSQQPVEVGDVMRRLVKEELLKFDGKPLFPERRAYTVDYDLSPMEVKLYEMVTEYVREEFNRADKLNNDRKSTVGFALTVLQRRLASSPEAIYQSLKRRRERLESRLAEERLGRRTYAYAEDFSDYDEDDLPPEEQEQMEEQVVDLASAAATIAEMEAEIETLKGIEYVANMVRIDGVDRKWDERKKAEELFKQDKAVRILIATDAAGEGINLQTAHLMINYDLPWNPNRLEQRFGRIHRIGQTEVCHLWNLVADETREGEVFQRLFQKLGRETATGKKRWHQSSVISILENEKYKGDGLLQKTYTTDFLTHKRVANDGQLKQYYVEDHHQGIVDEKTFELAQAEMARRRGHKGEYSGTSIFSSKIICGDCGCFFGSKVWHSKDKYRRTIWRCNHKYSDGHKCATPHITEDEIKALFLKSLNKLLADKESFIDDLTLLRSMAADTDALKEQAADLAAKANAAYAEIEELMEQNALQAQDQEEYNEKFEAANAGYEDILAQHKAVTEQIELASANDKLLGNFISMLQGMNGGITEFQDRVWAGSVESMTIFEKGKATVKFKGGIEIEVECT